MASWFEPWMKLLQVFRASNYTKWQLSNLVCHSPIRLRLSPTVEPSSTVVSLEWIDVQPAIGTKVSDYILQHKKVDEYTDTDLYTGKNISLFWGRGRVIVWQRMKPDFLISLWTWCQLSWEGTERFCVISIKQQQKVEGGKSSSGLEVTLVCDLMIILSEGNLIFLYVRKPTDLGFENIST